MILGRIGFNRVANAVCGSTAVEAAFKHAFIAYAQRKRGGMDVAPTDEEYASCMKNQSPVRRTDQRNGRQEAISHPY